MKRKIKRSTKVVLSIVFTVLLIGFVLSIAVYANRATEPLNTVVTGYLINITSLVISVIALVIAMITYFSIDSVNSVTTMEGNILENPSYTIAYSEMVKQFNGCKNQPEFMRELMRIINETCGKRTSTCMQYADFLQIIIDNLIWFAYVDFNNQEFSKECENLVKKLENEYKRYDALSNGIQYLLKEHVKLIQYVLIYQKSRNTEKNQICDLEDIRGKMILNPVSQVVYYDYLGLYYRRKANEILQQCGDVGKEFSYQYMQAVLSHDYSESDKTHFFIFINRAKQCFHNAAKISKSDVLWKGYVKYNQARLSVMEYLITPKNKENILKDIHDVKDIRETVCFLFNEPNTFLSQKFTEEYDLAVSLYDNFKKL